MTSQRIYQAAPKKTQTPITPQFTSRPFAPITRQTTPTPHQQPEQIQGLVQRNTNLLEIPGLMTQPEKRQSLNKLIQTKPTIGQPGDKYEPEGQTTVPQIEITEPEGQTTVPQIETTSQEPDNKLTRNKVLINQREAIKLLESKRQLLGSAADEIKRSIWMPEGINQGQFNFCGSNAFLMAIALNDPVSYMNYIIDLYTAKANYEAASSSGNAVANQTAKLGNMSVDVDQEVVSTDASEFADIDSSMISQTDWMSMGSIHTKQTADAPDYSGDSEVMKLIETMQMRGIPAALALQPTSDTMQKATIASKKWIRQKGQTVQSLAKTPFQSMLKDIRTVVECSMPSEIMAWFTNYGASNIVQKADPFNPSKSQNDIQQANSFLNASQGKMVMLNINSETITGNHSSITGFNPSASHWVLMETPLVKNTEVTPNVWEGKVYSWGKIMDIKIDDDKISNSFFGFIAATIIGN
ncbi:hypothetical protein [Nostoc sp. C117]|uniref:hypothetical protein n=1 Tax=Nostoc sp. C117 TaxID=3349875 RepID=UPI00370D44DD